MKTRVLTLSLALALAGCAMNAPQVPQAPLVQAATVTAVASLDIRDTADRQVLAVLEPWVKADIDHVELSLYEGATLVATATVAQADLSESVRFTGLRMNTSYTVKAEAWSDAGETSRIDNAEADAASCTTTFSTTVDEVVNVGVIKLELKDKSFSGTGTSSGPIEVTDGVLENPTATETITVALPTYDVTTVAGSTAGFLEGTGTGAQFWLPHSVALDGDGNLYVADTSNHRIRKIDSAGVVSTLAGGTEGTANGTGEDAQFSTPTGVAVDGDGNVYVADYGNHLIRKIDSAGVVTTLAGSGVAGLANNTGTAAQFDRPQSVALDASGNLYVADTENHAIRKVTPGGVVTTLAGGSTAGGYVNATGTAARFDMPFGVAVDGEGNVYVGDTDNHRIRKIDPNGVVTTIAGSGTADFLDGTGTTARFNGPYGLAVDADGHVYVAERHNNRIRKIYPNGEVVTMAGSTPGDDDGISTSAKLSGPYGVAVDENGHVYVADTHNHRIRKIQ